MHFQVHKQWSQLHFVINIKFFMKLIPLNSVHTELSIHACQKFNFMQNYGLFSHIAGHIIFIMTVKLMVHRTCCILVFLNCFPKRATYTISLLSHDIVQSQHYIMSSHHQTHAVRDTSYAYVLHTHDVIATQVNNNVYL